MKKKELNSRKRSQSYTPTPLSLGDVREVEISTLTPLSGRPHPRQVKSLPNTPVNNLLDQTYLPTSPTISEESYYTESDRDSEAEEVFYETIINAYQRDETKLKKEISDLHNEVNRLEADKATLQTESENKDNKLKETHQKYQQSQKENKLLKVENERVHLELKLTSSDYLVKDEQVRHLTERLNKEVENSKSLVAELESQWKENKEITHKQQELINQLSRLKNDKKIDEIERAELEQSLLEQAEEYKKQLQELKTKHKKEIQNYRLFNSLEREDEGNKKYKRKTLDYGMLSRYSSIYSDHNRASSMTSFPQSPTLDFEIALKTPKTAKSLQEELSGAIFNESEKSLDTTLNNLMGEINQVIEISPETVKELEDRILNLTQQQEAYQQHIQQQEVMVQELAQKNILLQEQLATEQDQTKRVRNMEQSLLILNQNNLGLAVEKDNLQEQLRQKDYQLQSSELKQANYYNFIKSLAEIFPLSETQQEKLNETDEPDKKFLSLLKTNIFGGVNKLREQITNSRTEIIEVEKQRQQLLNEVEELKKEKKSLEESMDLTELQEVVAELDELENYIEINNLLKNGK